jgi:hypothetical protein
MNMFTLFHDKNLKSILTQTYKLLYSELALNGKDAKVKYSEQKAAENIKRLRPRATIIR